MTKILPLRLPVKPAKKIFGNRVQVKSVTNSRFSHNLSTLLQLLGKLLRETQIVFGLSGNDSTYSVGNRAL